MQEYMCKRVLLNEQDEGEGGERERRKSLEIEDRIYCLFYFPF